MILKRNLFAHALLIVFVLVGLVFIVQFFQLHRIYSLSDVIEIIKVARLSIATDSPHCKKIEGDITTYRCLPTVFLIGASKSGTTSLLDDLLQDNSMSVVKRRIHNIDRHHEVHRFDRSSFPSTWKSLELLHEWASTPTVSSPSERAVIHYTPHYLFAPTVPFDMRTFYPHTSSLRFLILLRNPVDRMISSYWFKNSHLFHNTDQGTSDNLQEVIRKQQQSRQNYEICMLKFYQQRISSKIIDHYKIARSFRESSTLKSYCSSKIKDPNQSFSLTCKYLFLLKNILFSFFDCKVRGGGKADWTQPWTKSLQELNQTSQSKGYQWKSRCTRRKKNISEEEFQRRLLLEGLNSCYGKKQVRSRELGLSHVDKSIYVDQILRWWINFPLSEQFIIMRSETFFTQPSQTIQVIHALLRSNHSSHSSPSITAKAKRLFHPNSLAEDHTLSNEIVREYYNYFDIYNRFLFTYFLYDEEK